ncbi:hypothetical protein T492DRAFT_958386 [Pavlovales sp. CCMP2436]|nr:hypothetical protein T492DRAFT_958386 [Pavlovales sp. CCMP2436]
MSGSHRGLGETHDASVESRARLGETQGAQRGKGRLRISTACLGISLLTVASLVAFPALSGARDGGAAGDGVGDDGIPVPAPPTLVASEPRALTLHWAQLAPEGFRTESYDVELSGDGQRRQYNGPDGEGAFVDLAPASRLCARVRLRLQPGDVATRWSTCLQVSTRAPTTPRPMPSAWPLISSSEYLLAQWEPPEDGGAPIDAFELRLAALEQGLVDSCVWTGASCSGCAELPGEKNWTLAESEWMGMFAVCAGASSLGCCGLQCWCSSYRCCEKVPGTLRTNASVTPAPGSARNATLLALPLGLPFALELRAHNAAGWSVWSPELLLHGDAQSAAPPAAPQLRLTSLRAHALFVQWDEPADNGALLLGYELAVVPQAGAPANGARVLRLGPLAREAALRELPAQTAFALHFRAHNSRGFSPWTVLRAATHEPLPPPPPEGLTAVAALSDALTVAWLPLARGGEGADAVPDVIEVEVRAVALEVLANASGGAATIGACTAAPSARSCTVGGLRPDSEYALSARARSEDGWGGWGEAGGALWRTAADRGCSAQADHVSVLGERRALHATLDRCSKDCWAASECVGRCVARAGLSARCSACFGEVAACTKLYCLDKCALDPDGGACRECARAVCMDAYAECVGVPLALVP